MLRTSAFLFLPHFDVICDLLLNRRTATWNLFVKCSLTQRIITVQRYDDWYQTEENEIMVSCWYLNWRGQHYIQDGSFNCVWRYKVTNGTIREEIQSIERFGFWPVVCILALVSSLHFAPGLQSAFYSWYAVCIFIPLLPSVVRAVRRFTPFCFNNEIDDGGYVSIEQNPYLFTRLITVIHGVKGTRLGTLGKL